MTSTRDRALRIFESLIKDPYYQKTSNSSREEVVWKEAEQRARQANNNELALSMAVSDDNTSGAVKSLVAYLLAKAQTREEWSKDYEKNVKEYPKKSPDQSWEEYRDDVLNPYLRERGEALNAAIDAGEIKSPPKKAPPEEEEEARPRFSPAKEVTPKEMQNRAAAQEAEAAKLADRDYERLAKDAERQKASLYPEISRPRSASGRVIDVSSIVAPASFKEFDGNPAFKEEDHHFPKYTVEPKDENGERLKLFDKRGKPVVYGKDKKQAYVTFPLPLLTSFYTSVH